ncbi:MAG: hypothetical protein KF891_10915 [Rhizobacter sp.]|nr:hypothetical protein [Rhizobacter sp.]
MGEVIMRPPIVVGVGVIVGGRAAVPALVTAERGGSAPPAGFHARIDHADVGLDHAATTGDVAVGDHTPAARFDHLGGALGHEGMVVGVHAQRDVLGAAQEGVDRFLRPGGHELRALRGLAAL